jgi:hypothetical protein
MLEGQWPQLICCMNGSERDKFDGRWKLRYDASRALTV